jgi:hypothetical protein
MSDEALDGNMLLIDSGTLLIFRKSGTTVKISEGGVLQDDRGDASVREEASAVFDALGHWIGIHIPLAEVGFDWVGVELFEDMALDLLDDAYTEAAEADGHLRRFDEVDEAGAKIGHRLAAVPHIRKAIILAAASAEAYINEFIAKRLSERAQALDRIPTTAKWSVAVELATSKRLEDETDDLEGLGELFTLRNKLMHFHPSMKLVSFEEGGKVGQGGVVWRLQNEVDPMRFPSKVARCIFALHKITEAEDVDRVNDIVDRAIDKRIMDQVRDVSAIVGKAIDALGDDERAALKEAVKDWTSGVDLDADGDESSS